MKRKFSFLLAVLLLLSTSSIVYADSLSDDFVGDASKLVNTCIQSGVYPELNSSAAEGVISLCEPIPVYEVTVSGIEDAELEYYPVVGSGSVVGVITDRSGKLEFSMIFSDLFNEVYDSGEEMCFVMTRSTVYAIIDDECIVVREAMIDESRVDCDAEIIQNAALNTEFIEPSAIINVLSLADPGISGYLSVSEVIQASGSEQCWACCSISVGKFENPSINRTVSQILNEYSGGVDQARSIWRIQNVIEGEYGVDTSISISELSLNRIISEIGGREHPIVARIAHVGWVDGHFVVVHGYSSDPDDGVYIYIMDPLVGYRTISVSGGYLDYVDPHSRVHYETSHFLVID
ncbi:MAG: hypothetical protein E7218_02470 [Anaerofustis stercorihominis]|nr:hypothetical protein [Anaerofustis stercorihominis]